MSYCVIKTIKGRRYLYEQRTWREEKRVRTECRYIGPADGPKRRRLDKKIADFIRANLAVPPLAQVDEEQMLKYYNERAMREQKAREALLRELHDKYGLRLAGTPSPTVLTPEAPPAAMAAAQSDAEENPSNEAVVAVDAGAKESPSADEGRGAQNN